LTYLQLHRSISALVVWEFFAGMPRSMGGEYLLNESKGTAYP
jgi:hypothetical protein